MSGVWCLWTFLSGLSLIRAALAGRWGGLSAPSFCLIQVCRRPCDTEEEEEADGLRGRKWLRVRWWDVAASQTGNRDFSYHLITAGSSLGGQIKEVHLAFICCNGKFVYISSFAETVVVFVFSLNEKVAPLLVCVLSLYSVTSQLLTVRV